MRFTTPLVPARLIKRYKRFLADVSLEADGREVTVHCPNPGSMMGLAEPGMRVWLEPNDDPKKKLRFGWRLVEFADGNFAGIDTGVPNKMLKEALSAGLVSGLEGYENLRAEVKYGEASRVDFLLSGEGRREAYVEVKSVTLSRVSGLAEFPDSVTKRGAKHLAELSAMVGQGHRAVMLYLIQRTDCQKMSLSGDLDPRYLAAFEAAKAAGVEVICYDALISPEAVELGVERVFV